jgi:hypothetical protein
VCGQPKDSKRGGALVNRPVKGECFHWRCKKGHEWTTQESSGVRSGQWCPSCALEPKITRAVLQAIVEKRGGRMLDGRGRQDRIPRQATYRLRCAAGHEWQASGHAIHRGSWCIKCMGLAKGTIGQMQVLAAKNHGRCVSTEYINNVTALTWECSNGHAFEAAPVRIKRGAFCPYCLRRGAKGIGDFLLKDFRRMARARGGECLSTKYTNAHDYLRFRCQLGHEFEAAAHAVTLRSWCPECAHTKRPTLERINALSQERGGECTSKAYVNAQGMLSFRCARKHTFTLPWSRLKAGGWCRKCWKLDPREPDQMGLGELSELVERLGGECLSRDYEGANHKHQFRCRAGHTWETTPRGLKKGVWCGECTGQAKITIEEMRETAAFRGGRCLSKECRSNREKLAFECQYGHRWSATPGTVRHGTWCPRCLDTAPKLGIERMMALAKKRGGLCTSPSYHSPTQRLRFRCAEGHVWSAREPMVRREWCPRCPPRREAST